MITNIKKLTKTLMMLLILFTLVILSSVKLMAADFNASVSSAEVTQGETVTITLSFSSDVTIGMYDLSLEYDANILEYVKGADGGGGGSLRIYEDTIYTKSQSRTIEFKAKGVGSTELKIIQLGDVIDLDTADLNVKASSGKVTVKAPVTASSNNNLSGLVVSEVYDDGTSKVVTLSPEFSSGETTYNLHVPHNVARLALSATTEDAKATTAVSGTRMDEGDNSTTVTVTAENGSVKKYIIYTKKDAAPQEEPTPEPPADESRNITFEGKTYVITDITEGVTLPEGFETSSMAYNGNDIVIATDLGKVLKLVYLKDEGGNAKFAIYNDTEGFLPFVTYEISQRQYILLDVENNFYEGENAAINSSKISLDIININGYDVEVFTVIGKEGLYIVRGMNWNSEINYYFYDKNDGSMLKYFSIGNDESVDDGKNISDVSSTLKSQADAYEKRIDKRNIVIYVAGVLLLLMFVGIIVLIMKMKGDFFAEHEEDDDEEAATLEDESEGNNIQESSIEESNEEESNLEEGNAEEINENEIEEDIKSEKHETDEIAESLSESVLEALAEEIAAKEAVDELEEVEAVVEETLEEVVEEEIAEEPVTDEAITEETTEELEIEEVKEEVSEEIAEEIKEEALEEGAIEEDLRTLE